MTESPGERIRGRILAAVIITAVCAIVGACLLSPALLEALGLITVIFILISLTFGALYLFYCSLLEGIERAGGRYR